jgi:3-hydroxyacyl-CoA dehydrogenase
MVDLQTGAFAAVEKPLLESLTVGARDLKALVSHPDRGGRCARAVLLDTLSYAASLVPAIADDAAAVDAAMRLGYAWTYGPFELIDRLGAGWLADALAADGRDVPPFLAAAARQAGFYRTVDGRLQSLDGDGIYREVVRPDGVLLLADIKRRGDPVARNGSASLWDVGDGVACLEFHSKMNSLDADTLAMVRQSIIIVGQQFKALVIYNEGSNFSVGANIGLALFAANIAAWGEIEKLVADGQDTYQLLREAPFPVVGAPSGMALGGACEILLHCDAIQAHGELYMGLVEVGVGVIPAWGGCTQLLARWQADPATPQGPMPAVGKVFELISTARVAKSADEARSLHLLAPGDGITMNRDRLLFAAKARALALADGYHPSPPGTYRLPGPSGRVALGMAVDAAARAGKATPHDVTVCRHLAAVLTGGEHDLTDTVAADWLLTAERRHFMELIRTPATLARIETMLETGRPLRN